jgi:undecaprenyl-phosphate 4-deoxy-4-formamido-L-arabinose transferase
MALSESLRTEFPHPATNLSAPHFHSIGGAARLAPESARSDATAVAPSSVRGTKAGISVIIPVYNSAQALGELLVRLQRVLKQIGCEFEVILVNDCSRDASWETICEQASSRRWLRGMNLMRNFGQHNAILCGIRAARYATIVTMDDDLQNPPEEIPRLLERLSAGNDVVYGTPEREQHGLLRDVASQITKLALQKAMGAETARKISAFRAFRTELRNAFTEFDSSHVSIDVLLTWGTTRFAAIPVQHDRRTLGVSNYTVAKLIRHALNMMTGFSTWPLRLASIVGFVFTLFGMLVLAYVVGRYLFFGTVVAGFPFLASIIAIFSGAQLFALGIMGEYLARMHLKMMTRPVYVVRETTPETEHARAT